MNICKYHKCIMQSDSPSMNPPFFFNDNNILKSDF